MIIKKVLRNIIDLLKKYPDGPTTELLGYYLEEVNLDEPENNDSEDLSKMIDEYIEKIFLFRKFRK